MAISQRRNIHKVVFINFCTNLHFYLHISALFLQQHRGFNLFEISSLETFVAFFIFLIEVPSGVIADWLGRKWTLVLWALFLLIGETLFLISETYPHLLIMALFTGAGHALGSGTKETLIYDSLPPENRDKAMQRYVGQLNSGGRIAFFISPILGALIIGNMGLQQVQFAIVLTMAALFIGLIVSFTLKEPPQQSYNERLNAFGLLRNGVNELRQSPKLRKMLLIVVFTASFNGALIVTFSAPYQQQNAVSPFAIGLSLSIGSLLAALTQHYAYKIEEWLGPSRAFLGMLLLPGLSYLVLALFTGPVITWLIIIWLYAINDMRAPLLSAYQNKHITNRSRATVLSLINMCASLFVVILSPIYALIATYSMPLMFVVMGTVIIAACIVLRPQDLVRQA